jgi:hypothetical protein
MSAGLWACRGRGLVVVLASGAVVSLTALTGGITPALADPKSGPSTTAVSPPEPQGKPSQHGSDSDSGPPAVPTQAAPAPVIPPEAPPVKAPPPQTQQAAPAPQEISTPAPSVVSAPTTVAAPPAPPAIQATTTVAAPSTVAAPPATVTTPPATVAATPPATVTAAPPTKPVPASPTTQQAVEPTATSSAPNPVPRIAAPNTTSAVEAPAPSGPSVAKSSEVQASGTAAPTSGAPSVAVAEQPSARSGAPTTSAAVSEAGKAIEVHQATKLQAPEQDVELARASKPVEVQQPDPAPKADVDALFTSALHTPVGNVETGARFDLGHRNDGRDWNWNHPVQQWDSNWVHYDDYYRPVIYNPFRQPVKIVYVYQAQPRIVVVQPLASIVLNALAYGAYSFTALAVNAVDAVVDAAATAVNVAVGTFFGGGYYPGPYMAPPPPPPPLVTYDNVPVFVRYSHANYDPFVVHRIVDVGDDSQYGERRVLLDGVTPAWGAWTQGPDGQRQFEVHRTQQYPGLDSPNEGPLPGYQLQLASDSSSGFSAKDVYGLVAVAVLGTLSLCGAVALAIWRRRTRVLH